MFSNKSDYDRGVNTFSPEGRIFQVEYAMEAVKLGTTAIGIQVEAGTLIAVEKRITSNLLDPSSIDKILKIDEHVGCAIAGIVSDGKSLVEKAREDANQHRFNYDEPISIDTCAQFICDVSLDFGEGKKNGKRTMSRPYGVALLLAGIDLVRAADAQGNTVFNKIPRLFHTDPSGTYMRVDYKAIGAAAEGAQNILREEWYKSMTLEETERLAVRTLRQVMEDKVDSTNVELALASTATGLFRAYTLQEVRAILDKYPGEGTQQ